MAPGWGRYYYDTSDIMNCVNVNADVFHWKTNPPSLWRVRPQIENDNSLCRMIRCGTICICFCSIYQSLVLSALDRCDSALVQIKFHEIEKDGASRPVGKKGWGVWWWQTEKRSFVALKEGYRPPWWMEHKEQMRWSQSDELFSHPATHFTFSFLPFQVIWSFFFFFFNLMCAAWGAGRVHVSLCDPALIILFIKCLFN